MRLALLQMTSVCGDPDANLEWIESAMGDAAVHGSDLLLAPELAVTGYGAGKAIVDFAQSATGAWFKRLHAAAQRLAMHVVAGFPERDGDYVFNSAMIVDPASDGPRVYRKSHLYADYERSLFTPGTPSTVRFTCAGIACAPLICYDVEFPENVRRLALDGVDLALVPTALPDGQHAPLIAEKMIAVRAFENQIFVAYANHAGADERFAYAGRSCIAAPDGTLLGSAPPDRPALFFARIDPAAYQASRQENTYLDDLARPA